MNRAYATSLEAGGWWQERKLYGWLLLLSTVALLCKVESFSDLFTEWYLFAEDGTIFMHQAETMGFRAIWQPYAGYQHLYIRLVAGLANFFALPFRPPILLLGWFFSYWMMCLFIFRSARALHFSLTSLWVLALFIPLQPTYDGSGLFTITSAYWSLWAEWLIWFLTLRAPCSFSIWKGVGLLLMGLTGPCALVVLPILFIKGLCTSDFKKNRWIYFILGASAAIPIYYAFYTNRIVHIPHGNGWFQYLEPFGIWLLFSKKWHILLYAFLFWTLFTSLLVLRLKLIYPNHLKYGFLTRRRPEFEPNKVGAEAAKLKQVSDADELTFSGCPTASQTHASRSLGIHRVAAATSSYIRSFIPALGNRNRSVSERATLENKDTFSLTTFLLLLSTGALVLAASMWSQTVHIQDVRAGRYFWIPRTCLFFCSLWLIQQRKICLGVLVVILMLLCKSQFTQVERPNPCFTAFTHYASYRDLLIPIHPLTTGPYPEEWCVHSMPTRTSTPLPKQAISLAALKVDHAQATYQPEQLILHTESPLGSLTFCAPLETPTRQPLLVEINLNRSIEGWVSLFWSHDGHFSKKCSAKRWYPSGSIVAQFAVPSNADPLLLRVHPLEEAGEATLRQVNLYHLPPHQKRKEDPWITRHIPTGIFHKCKV